MMQELTSRTGFGRVNNAAVIEHAFRITRDYVRERKAFGKHWIDLQHPRIEMARSRRLPPSRGVRGLQHPSG